MKSNELMNEFVPDSIKSDIITSANRLARLRNENNWDEGVEMCESHLEEIALASWFLWFGSRLCEGKGLEALNFKISTND